MDSACRKNSTAKAVLHMRSAPSGEVTAHLIQPRSSESGSEDQGKQQPPINHPKLTDIAILCHTKKIGGADMASMNISLPDPMKDWVETQTNSGRYDNASEYVRDLIRHDQDRASKISAMQKLVDEAFEGGASDKSLDDIWAAAKAQATRGN